MKIGPQFKRGWARIMGKRNALASATAQWLGQRATRLMLFPFGKEHVELPTPIRVGTKTLDVVDDLTRFTSLPPEQVHALLMRRPENFRSEWLMLPPELRQDTWYYLSSRTYLFANAVHIHDAPQLIDAVATAAPTGGRILELGDGQPLPCARGERASRLTTWNSLRFRRISRAFGSDDTVFRRTCGSSTGGLRWTRRATTLCVPWTSFEHIPDLPETLERVVNALADGGALVESSPFVVNESNPMHHDDPGFDDLLRAHALDLAHAADDHRVWRKSPR